MRAAALGSYCAVRRFNTDFKDNATGHAALRIK
jgi:hypothetical protein